MRRRWRLIVPVPLVLAGGVLWALGQRQEVPTTEARKGDWTDWLEVRGEVQALRSLTLTAPSRAGSDLPILKIAASGTAVKAGDVVAEFDSVRRQRTLDEQRAALRQAAAEVDRLRAEARLQAEESRTRLLKSSYDVERARLEASKVEIVSAIEGEKKKLDLADREQALRSLRSQVAAEQASWSAQIAGGIQKRRTAEFDANESAGMIEAMTLRAPVSGTLTILPNYRARTGGWGSSAPEFKVGDRVWPGAAIAELPDLSTVRVAARVDESDRGRLRAGQTARVRIDALPDRDFDARVAEISPLAKIDFDGGWPWPKNFDVVFALQNADRRLRSGMSGTTRVAVAQTAGVVIVPARACFHKAGRTVAYVRRLWRFEERTIETARRSKTEVVVSRGLAAGEKVALADPTAPPEGSR